MVQNKNKPLLIKHWIINCFKYLPFVWLSQDPAHFALQIQEKLCFNFDNKTFSIGPMQSHSFCSGLNSEYTDIMYQLFKIPLGKLNAFVS